MAVTLGMTLTSAQEDVRANVMAGKVTVWAARKRDIGRKTAQTLHCST